MACKCSNKVLGKWSNGSETIVWGVNSKCAKSTLELPKGFASLEDFCPETRDGSLLSPTSKVLLEKFQGAFEATGILDDNPAITRAALEEFLAGAGDKLKLCCVTYKIAWQPSNFAGGDLITLKKFSVGNDTWGPFPAYNFPGQPANPVTQFHTVQVCKQKAECKTMPIGKLEFEKRVGGAGPVGKDVALGTIGDLKICKLS